MTAYIWESHHKVMEKCFLGCLDNLLHANTVRVISILYIFSDAAVKQYWLLGHNAYLSPYEGHVDSL